MTAPDDRGRFIVLDGIDGCGKTTQAERLVQELGALHLREPGSTSIGERIRELLLGRQYKMGPEVETLLFASARRQMLDELVEPALAAGRHVVCERFHPSTYAYQAVAGDLDEDTVLGLLVTWAGTPRPDLVIILDVDPEQAAARRGASTDRIEDKGGDFQKRVAEGHRRYAERAAGVRVVDGDASADVVAARVSEEARRVL